jgi:hypothetical protein
MSSNPAHERIAGRLQADLLTRGVDRSHGEEIVGAENRVRPVGTAKHLDGGCIASLVVERGSGGLDVRPAAFGQSGA